MRAERKKNYNEVLADTDLTPVLFPPSPNPAEAVLRISSLTVA